MKFKGHGIVWDAENNRVLCKFEKGEVETNDNRVIELLKSAGYEHEEPIKEVKKKSKGAE